MEFRCQACNAEVDLSIDQEFCPTCFESYLDNLKEIMPKEDL